MARHTCHAFACTAEVQPKFFMCKMHWALVPGAMRDAIWRHYRPGQERTKDPSREYLWAAWRAKVEVAVIEGLRTRARADEMLRKRAAQLHGAYDERTNGERQHTPDPAGRTA